MLLFQNLVQSMEHTYLKLIHCAPTVVQLNIKFSSNFKWTQEYSEYNENRKEGLSFQLDWMRGLGRILQTQKALQKLLCCNKLNQLLRVFFFCSVYLDRILWSLLQTDLPKSAFILYLSADVCPSKVGKM